MSAETAAAADPTTVYVVMDATFSSGDVSGCLLLDTGEVLWDHISSSIGWLERDLTSGFSDRRQALDARYPNGWQVVIADKEGVIPADVLARNEEWAGTQAEERPAEVAS